MPEYPSGTVAFLFTDIEGSTKGWEAQPAAMRVAVERHFAILREAITDEGGVLFKIIGDAVQAAFPTVPAAVAAAIAAQVALRREDWGELGPPRVRMAIHAGEATPQNGDYLAPALNRLARVLAAGHGEQILLTETARALATLPVGYALQDLGRQQLRDLLEAEHIFQVTGPGLPADFPPLKSLDRHLHNLPAQPTPLIGRERELEGLCEMLTASQTRLVTLVGPGGTGKTRLALQAGSDVLDHFPDGVWWVPLASVSDPSHVPQAIAASLKVRESPGEPLETTLAAYLKSRRTLLLLDNFEHVLAAARILPGMLDAAPDLVILATSREPLRLRAEREFPVAPLALPESGPRAGVDEAMESPAVRLFVSRAQAVKPGFSLDARNVADVVAICRRLDGLPLAIELAAARVRLLPPATLLARLDRGLSILTGGARDLPERQQTLRAAIAWSYDLLGPAERTLFARFAIFAGGFTVDAAEAVCNVAGGLSLDVLDAIDSLVQKSLLRQEEGPGDESRFTMLETIREFAVERLQELPEYEDLRQEHAETYLALAESANWDDLEHQVDLLNRLEADRANFRQAVAFFEAQGAAGQSQRVRLAAALAYFWWFHGHFAEGRDVLERAIAARGDIPIDDRAAAVSGAAFLAEAQGDLERAQALQLEVLALSRESGNKKGIARALAALGEIARQLGDLDEARGRYQGALDASRDAGDQAGVAGALIGLGLVHQLEGDYADAEPALLEGLRIFGEVGDLPGRAHALNRLGLLAMSTGNLSRAIEKFEQSLELWRELGNQRMIAADLHNLGEAHLLSGSLERAEHLHREALDLFDALGDIRGRGLTLWQLGLLALDRGNPADARDLLRESLRLCWSAGLRGSAADTLEALAEATVQLGDLSAAAIMLGASNHLREETGQARQPVYEPRYDRVAKAVGLAPTMEPRDVDELVATITSGQAMAAL